jgi:hypothetical protein
MGVVTNPPCLDTLLIALATASKQLRVVRVNIHWGLPPTEKQMPPSSLLLNPSLKEKRLAATSWFQPESSQDASMEQLSHVEVLPSMLGSRNLSPPVVLTFRSYVPQTHTPYSQEVHTIIDRWEILEDQPESLHPAFAQLGQKKRVDNSTLVCFPDVPFTPPFLLSPVPGDDSAQKTRLHSDTRQGRCVRSHGPAWQSGLPCFQRRDCAVSGPAHDG